MERVRTEPSENETVQCGAVRSEHGKEGMDARSGTYWKYLSTEQTCLTQQGEAYHSAQIGYELNQVKMRPYNAAL
ncbi:MAG: hypothetical protein ACYCX4_07225, partial [Bacillota bacterium]